MKEKETQIAIIVSAILSLGISFLALNTARGINERMDRANYEYQLVIEDNSVKVFDGSRYVGTASLEGQLKDILVADNE